MIPDRQRLAIEERIARQEGRGSLGPDAAEALAELRFNFWEELRALEREQEEREGRALLARLAAFVDSYDPDALAELTK